MSNPEITQQSTSTNQPEETQTSPEPDAQEALPESAKDDESANLLKRIHLSKPSAVNTEFLYYSTTLREVAPKMSSDADRQMIIPWIRKLFRPEYHSPQFKVKRNKFLLYLTLTILNDEAYGIFRSLPPNGALPNFDDLYEESFPLAEWEMDSMWQDMLDGLPENLRRMKCSVHDNEIQCVDDHSSSQQLDAEFAFLLYLMRPFAILLPNNKDRINIAAWLQTLCTIRQQSCNEMKKLRNQYAEALLGYLHELRVTGPFVEAPRWSSLLPLADAVKLLELTNRSVLDPGSAETSEFLATQPIPDEGAFCYIAVTGELLNSNLEEQQ